MTTSDDSPQYGHRIMTLSVSSFIGRYVDHVKQVLPVNGSHPKSRLFRAHERFSRCITACSTGYVSIIVIGRIRIRPRVQQQPDLAYAPSRRAFAPQE